MVPWDILTNSVMTETSPNWDLEIRIAIVDHVQAPVLKDFVFI